MAGFVDTDTVFSLISSIVTIYEEARDVYEAASDTKGLPRKFRMVAERIPLVLKTLDLAEKNIEAEHVSEEAMQAVLPVLEQCKESAVGLKSIFDQTIPDKDETKLQRYGKALRNRINSRKVQGYMEETFKSLELLAQNQVFQDGGALQAIKEAIEELREEEEPHFVQSGAGAINANSGGGTMTNNTYSYSGSGGMHIGTQVENQYVIHRHFQNRAPIAQRIPYAKGATFGSYGQDYSTCHTGTRVGLLGQIKSWAQQTDNKSIFWLNGMAGTGKSTVSWTVAEWLTEQRSHGVIDLGASFFFKRGEDDRGNGSRFFPTIARDLVLKIPKLGSLIAEVIDSDPSIFDKALGEQFDKLIYRPLQKLDIQSGSCSTFVLVVDALDECGPGSEANIGTSDAEVILGLLPRISQVKSVCLRLFLTSRPEPPILQGVSAMPATAYQTMVLHEIPKPTIKHDISVFLRDEFSKIRKRYNTRLASEDLLDDAWPEDAAFEALVDMADRLFIVAVTICRYIGYGMGFPPDRLEKILKGQLGHLKQMERIYLTVLTPSNCPDDEAEYYREFREIVGSIISLAKPLSARSLAALLSLDRRLVLHHLTALHSVLAVPAEPEPVRTFHLSFGEFLLSSNVRGRPFSVDSQATHRLLYNRCLELLSGPNGLQKNLCDLAYPGQLRDELASTMIDSHLPPEIQYACRYWVYHVGRSTVQIHDDDKIHVFLQEHFLHWLEAFSFMGRIPEVIELLGVLRSLELSNTYPQLTSFLEDAKKFVVSFRSVLERAPLQTYAAALIFCPAQTEIKRLYWRRREPFIKHAIGVREFWDPCRQTLEGHSSSANAVAFSLDGRTVVSASSDQTVRLWDTDTGVHQQTLEGHSRMVTAVAFSPDGRTIASGSSDKTVRLWDAATGVHRQTLEGHTDSVRAVAFSPDGKRIASGSEDQTVRLWDAVTGVHQQTLAGHLVAAVTFSPDSEAIATASSDQTIWLWDAATGTHQQTLEGHSHWVNSVSFSPDGKTIASASSDKTVRLWDAATGAHRQTLDGHNQWVNAVAFSPDGKTIASASYDKTIMLWDAATGMHRQTLKGHNGSINFISFSSDGKAIASASYDKTVRLWDTTISEYQQEGHSHWVNVIAFSPNGKTVASSSDDQTVRLWDAATGVLQQTLKGSSGFNALAFSPDGKMIASASNDQTIWLWDITGKLKKILKGHKLWASAITFSPNGKTIASASNDQTVRLWDITGVQRQTLKGHSGFNAVAFSPDSQMIASASNDQTVWIWDTKGTHRETLIGHSGPVRAIAFSIDGRILASASDDKTVRLWLWNATSGAYKQTQLLQVDQSFQHLSFSKDGQYIETDRGGLDIGSDLGAINIDYTAPDGRIFVTDDWVTRDGRNLFWLPHEYRATYVAVYGDIVVLGHTSGRVTFFQLA